jgi:hypothetical protein
MVRDPARPGATEEGSDVLNADDRSGQRRVIAHAKVDVFGENGQREADREIDHETESREADDISRARVPRHEGRVDFSANHSSWHGLRSSRICGVLPFQYSEEAIPNPHNAVLVRYLRDASVHQQDADERESESEGESVGKAFNLNRSFPRRRVVVMMPAVFRWRESK